MTWQSGYCASWESDYAAMGLMSCTPDGTVCTKLFGGHLNQMAKSTGVLMMKRLVCDSIGCKVRLGE